MFPPLAFMLLGIGLGSLLGYSFLGPAGAFLGIVVGGALSGIAVSARPAARKAPAGTKLARDRQPVLCETRGQFAEATFVRDARTGAWLDVADCTLCTPPEKVSCEKRCLLLIRDVAPARTHPVYV